MKFFSWSSVLACSFLLTACAPPVKTYVVPKAGGLYTARATSSDEAVANEAAISKAHSTCFNDKNKTLEVTNMNTVYHGVDKNLKNAVNFARTTAFMNGANVSMSSMDKDDDYEVVIDFQCK